MMNKFLIVVVAVAVSSLSFGGLLFWEVDTAAVSNAGIENWSYASLYYVNGNQSGALENLVGGFDGTAQKLSADIFSSALVAAQLGNDVTSSWSFYVELYNSANVAVGKSATLSYTDLSNYIKESVDMSNLADIQRWSGGAYTAVPEPTSAVLLMLGMALTALRRKRI